MSFTKYAKNKTIIVFLLGAMLLSFTSCAQNTNAKKDIEVKEAKLEVILTGEQVTVIAGEGAPVEKFIKEISEKDAEVTFSKGKLSATTEEGATNADSSKETGEDSLEIAYNKKNVPVLSVTYDKVAEKLEELIITELKAERVESKIKVVVVDEIAKYAKGITDNVNVLKGTEGIDLTENIEFDKAKIKSIIVDDSNVNYKKVGTYDLIYSITTTDDKKVEVPVQIVVVDEETAKDMVNNGEIVMGGDDKKVDNAEDKKEEKSETEDNASKDIVKDSDGTINTGDSNSGNSGDTSTGNTSPPAPPAPPAPAEPSNPNTGATEVPAQPEDSGGKYENQKIGEKAVCYCGQEFGTYSEWKAHSNAAAIGAGCHGYTPTPIYGSVWVPN